MLSSLKILISTQDSASKLFQTWFTCLILPWVYARRDKTEIKQLRVIMRLFTDTPRRLRCTSSGNDGWAYAFLRSFGDVVVRQSPEARRLFRFWSTISFCMRVAWWQRVVNVLNLSIRLIYTGKLCYFLFQLLFVCFSYVSSIHENWWRQDKINSGTLKGFSLIFKRQLGSPQPARDHKIWKLNMNVCLRRCTQQVTSVSGNTLTLLYFLPIIIFRTTRRVQCIMVMFIFIQQVSRRKVFSHELKKKGIKWNWRFSWWFFLRIHKYSENDIGT